jgi:protein-S-isoprenylcysteine O-methyltransferase Ste14
VRALALLGGLAGTVAAGDDRTLLVLQVGLAASALFLVCAFVLWLGRREKDLARRVGDPYGYGTDDPQPSWPDISKPEIRG